MLIQTIFVTVTISVRDTTPETIAKSAPTIAVIPIFNPFGCQITKIKVITKIVIAIKVINDSLNFLYVRVNRLKI